MSEKPKTEQLSATLKPAFLTLLTATDYAMDTGSSPWDFAVPIQQLKNLGITETDFRWLVRKRYVEHACEVTSNGDGARAFQASRELTFSDRTCFVLTEAGVSIAKSLAGRNPVMNGFETPVNGAKAQASAGPAALLPYHQPIPHWDGQTRELSVDGAIVKRFKWQAVNQEIILSAFEEDGWPVVIDDPLPQAQDQDPKRRLQNTIKALNRHQEQSLIRFCGNGTGEGVRWRFA